MRQNYRTGFKPVGEGERLMAPKHFSYLHNRGNDAAISIERDIPWLASLAERASAVGGEVVFNETIASVEQLGEKDGGDWKVVVDCRPFDVWAIQGDLETLLLDVIQDDRSSAELAGYSALLRRIADAIDLAAGKADGNANG